MSDFVATKIDPIPGGTPVTEVNSLGQQTGRQFWSSRWDSRPQTRPDGCPVWIYHIVVGDTPDGAAAAMNLVAQDTSLVSSSVSSRDLQVVHVDGQGHFVEFFQVPYALVPKVVPASADGQQPPQAIEMWFCQQPFDPATGVQGLEQQCKTQS